MHRKPRILMIDDSKMLHGVVRNMLPIETYEFLSAFDGQTGLNLAASSDPDLILLDVEMPSPNGFEVCRELRSRTASATVPIIFITSLASPEEKVHGLDLGATDYVTKPFDAAELKARVRASLRIKELVDLLATKAMVDGLTALWNRSSFDQRLKEETAYAQHHQRIFSCILIDLDHFKKINDTHGHGFGDIVLKGISSAIRETCRSEDVAFRYGGEEFAILSRETCADAALVLAQRLCRAVAAIPFERNGVTLEVTCSLGVADSKDPIDTIVERADQALYEAKRLGRNRVIVFDPAKIAA